MTDEQKQRFDECIKSLPPRDHTTPESMLDAYKAKQKAKIDEEDKVIYKGLQPDDAKKIIKELHSISQELNTLNRILKRR